MYYNREIDEVVASADGAHYSLISQRIALLCRAF